MNQKHILAIDDEKVILDSIVKLCSPEGWHVDRAEDAFSGLKKIKANSYNLIICDIMMPQMNGFELLEQLRQWDIKTPIIITTGYSTVENAVKSLYVGAIDFLPKPFTFDELISCIKRGLEYSEIQNQILKQVLDSDSKGAYMPYVPCPPKYQRLGYSSWAYLENDGSVKIGLTDLFMRTIDSVEHIELFKCDEEIIQGNSCCQVTSGDQLIHNVLAPLSGRILQANSLVVENKSLAEKDPYFEGWLYLIIPRNLAFESKHLVPCSTDRL